MSCGSATGVGVEGVATAATAATAWGGQRRKGASSPPPPPPPPLSSVAVSRRLESAADAAASFNPLAVAVAATQRCAAAKGTAVDAAAAATALRPPRNYPASVVAPEINKEDAMEPEAKEEDERRSSTPSPEVAFSDTVALSRMCDFSAISDIPSCYSR